MDYLARLKRLADEVRPAWISDHLCWTGVRRPQLARPAADAAHRGEPGACRRARAPGAGRPRAPADPREPQHLRPLRAVDDGRSPSSCAGWPTRPDCGLLLDVNNVFVSCFNTGADPVAYLDAFPCERVVQMHLAGHQQHGSHIIDTHDRPVRAEVWELFRLAWARTGGASTLLEWDGDIPGFAECHAELLKAERYMDGGFDPAARRPARARRRGRRLQSGRLPRAARDGQRRAGGRMSAPS